MPDPQPPPARVTAEGRLRGRVIDGRDVSIAERVVLECDALDAIEAHAAAEVERATEPLRLAVDAQASEMRALRAERDELRAVLREVEWGNRMIDDRGDWYDTCPSCGALSAGAPSGDGHAPDCKLAAALGEEGSDGE